MPTKRIFDTLGGAFYTQLPTSKQNAAHAYITLAASGSSAAATTALKTILLGRAPATHIQISQNIDVSTTKAFAGDYLVSTFGHSLVGIIIKGLDIFYSKCIGNSGANNTIQTFFDEYNVYDNPKARVHIGMSGTSKSTAFQCVLTSMVREKSDKSGNIHIGDYTIQLIGVKI